MLNLLGIYSDNNSNNASSSVNQLKVHEIVNEFALNAETRIDDNSVILLEDNSYIVSMFIAKNSSLYFKDYADNQEGNSFKIETFNTTKTLGRIAQVTAIDYQFEFIKIDLAPEILTADFDVDDLFTLDFDFASQDVTPLATNGLEVQDEQENALGTITESVKIKNLTFDNTTKTLEAISLVPNTYVVDSVTGNDTTGEYENYNKPYKTIAGVMANYPNTTYSGQKVIIFLRNAGTHNLTGTLPCMNYRIYSNENVILDLSNNSNSQIFRSTNTTFTFEVELDMPSGEVKNTSTSRWYCEDAYFIYNINKLNLTGSNTSNYFGRYATIRMINDYTCTGNIGTITETTTNLGVVRCYNGDKYPKFLTSGQKIFNISNLICANTSGNPVGDGQTFRLNNVGGGQPLQFHYTHGDTSTVEFLDCNVSNGIKFNQNIGTHTFKGKIKTFGGFTSSYSSISGRVGSVYLEDLVIDNWVGSPITKSGTLGDIRISRCFINRTGTNIVSYNSNAGGQIKIENSTIIQSIEGALFNIVNGVDNIPIINNGLETNATSLTNTNTSNTTFEIISFKDKSKEISIRSKYDIINKSLDTSFSYIIDGNIILLAGEYIEVPDAGNLTINGYGLESSKITKAVTGESIFKKSATNSAGLQLQGLKLDGGGVGTCFDLEDSTGNNALEFNVVNFENFASIGTLKGYRQFLGTTLGIYGCSSGFIIDGTWSGFKITNTNVFGFGASGKLFQAGPTLLFNSRFYAELNTSLPTGAILSDFSIGNFNSNKLFQLKNGQYTLNGSNDAVVNTPLLLPNISEKEDVAFFEGNQGISNSFAPFSRIKGEDGLFYEVYIDATGTLTARTV